jgi:hypothetical protein
MPGPGSYRDSLNTAAKERGRLREEQAMRISRIAQRVASVVHEMNYAQRRNNELFMTVRGPNR